jgi:hypothetical protein
MMSDTECFRALGVAPYASWEEIRQAHKDLVRVWHPDRFQSDPEMRQKAQLQLQKINEAYDALKKSPSFWARSGEPATPQPPPPQPAPAASAHPPRRFGFAFGWTLRTAWLGLALLVPMVFAGVLANSFRVAKLDSELLQNIQPRLAILNPSQTIVPLGDSYSTSNDLSSWAREKARDLWRSMPKIGEGPSERVVTPIPAALPDAPVEAAVPQRPRGTAPVAPAAGVNGTELLWTHRSGAGELWVSNETNQDAFATLVQSHTTAPVRAIYIQAKDKVCMRNIAPGMYDLLAEVGENWDPRRVRFIAGRHVLDRSGPFQCVDVTSTQGTTGCKYDVVLKIR